MRFLLLARRMFLAPVLSLALAAATAARGSSSSSSASHIPGDRKTGNRRVPSAGMTRTARTDDQGQRDPALIRQPDWLGPELATLTAGRVSDPASDFERKFA